MPLTPRLSDFRFEGPALPSSFSPGSIDVPHPPSLRVRVWPHSLPPPEQGEPWLATTCALGTLKGGAGEWHGVYLGTRVTASAFQGSCENVHSSCEFRAGAEAGVSSAEDTQSSSLMRESSEAEHRHRSPITQGWDPGPGLLPEPGLFSLPGCHLGPPNPRRSPCSELRPGPGPGGTGPVDQTLLLVPF